MWEGLLVRGSPFLEGGLGTNIKFYKIFRQTAGNWELFFPQVGIPSLRSAKLWKNGKKKSAVVIDHTFTHSFDPLIAGWGGRRKPRPLPAPVKQVKKKYANFTLIGVFQDKWSHSAKYYANEHTLANPGFPRREMPTPKLGASLLFGQIPPPQNCMNMKAIGPREPVPAPPWIRQWHIYIRTKEVSKSKSNQKSNFSNETWKCLPVQK